MKFNKIATVLLCLFPITVFSQAATPAAKAENPIVVKKYSFKIIDFSGEKQI